MDQCKPFEDAKNKGDAVLVSNHAIGGSLDKGFPYDDSHRDDALAPSLFPGFYKS